MPIGHPKRAPRMSRLPGFGQQLPFATGARAARLRFERVARGRHRLVRGARPRRGTGHPPADGSFELAAGLPAASRRNRRFRIARVALGVRTATCAQGPAPKQRLPAGVPESDDRDTPRALPQWSRAWQPARVTTSWPRCLGIRWHPPSSRSPCHGNEGFGGSSLRVGLAGAPAARGGSAAHSFASTPTASFHTSRCHRAVAVANRVTRDDPRAGLRFSLRAT